MKTIIEPFKIKSVEPIFFTTREERVQILQQAFYNLFLVKAHDVTIDLLTDSGTAAMSSQQWAGIMYGDESYAGSDSFYRFESVVRNITGMNFVIPVHQGRAAERLLFNVLEAKGKYFISNTLFDTTRANIEFVGAEGVDLVCDEARSHNIPAPFKGNINIPALEQFILDKGTANISMVIITITNNSGGGQPVSMENIKQVKTICAKYKVLFYIDACRFAENCYFIKNREAGYADKSILEIAQELFSYADGCMMSAKKDGLANIGGFIAMRDAILAEKSRDLLVVTEGFPTYGGLAGRDLEAISIGLEEVLNEGYLQYRIRSIAYLGEKLDVIGIPYIKPTGGHAIYLDAKVFLPHIPENEFPGLSLCNALYLEGGIRGVEIGSVMFGKYTEDGKPISAAMELVRLAFPRRVYTQSHVDYIIEIIIEVFQQRGALRGYQIVYEPHLLRHFSARFKSLE